MRPKIVILTLAMALGLVGLVAVFKGMAGKRGSDVAAQNPGETDQPAPTSPNNPVRNVSTNNPALAQELRATEIEKQLDEIRGIIVDGQANPAGTTILVGKVTHPEAVVRAAALEAIMALNDTNAIPRLQEAQQIVEDPREKVAIMDLVAYLQLPETMPDVPPTNVVDSATTSSNEPALQRPSTTRQQRSASKAARRRQGMNPAAPAGATQPQSDVPAADAGQAPAPAPQTSPQ